MMRRTPLAILAALLAGVVFVLSAAAQQAASAPTAAALDETQRVERLISLIEGANPPQARLTGALELLRDPSPEVVRRLTAILTGANNRAAKIAVAQAIAASAGSLRPEFAPPLLRMLADADDAESRVAAAAALATSALDETAHALRDIARDDARHVSERLAAVEALGRMTLRAAAGALVDVLECPDPAIQRAALAALQNSTAQSFRDLQSARAWWEESRNMSLEEWQRLQIGRLVARGRATQQRVAELESRLATALRDGLFRAPESERPALLASYLGDPMTGVRIAGLDIVRSLLTDGKTVPAEIVAQVRNLLTATDAAIRIAAVRAIAAVRDPADGRRLTAMLEGERTEEVRQAIVAALGFVGGPETVGTLLRVLESSDRALLADAVVSLGRLAERVPIEGPERDAAVAALLARFRDRSTDAAAPRDALLRAMARLGDARFAASMIEALSTRETPAVRQAAARGIAALAEPKVGAASAPVSASERRAALAAQGVDVDALAGAVMEAVGDADPGVRKAATDALAAFAGSEAHLLTLWGRVSAAVEPDEGVREAAWKGCLRLLATRPAAEIDGWIARLPDAGPIRARRTIDLLQLMERSLLAQGDAAEKLGEVRVRIAEQRLALQQASDAVGAYVSAIDELRAARPARAAEVAVELLRAALRFEAYDGRVAAALRNGDARLPPQEIWKVIRAEVEPLVERDTIDRAVTMLSSVVRNPPFSENDEVYAALIRLSERAREIQAAADLDTVTAALAALRSDPQNQAARQRIEKLGPRATAPLRTALRHEIENGEAAGTHERVLHDLIKSLVPAWPGFDAAASQEDKLRAVASIEA